MIPPIEDCEKAGHMICEEGSFCFLCTYRTDLAFAIHSKRLLERLKRIDQEEIEEAA